MSRVSMDDDDHMWMERAMAGAEVDIDGDRPEHEPLNILPATRWERVPVPPREWLLDQWIPMAQTTALYGDGGVGKSLLAQQLGTCVALGRQFMGVETKAGTMLGIFCEDDDHELHRRQASINAWLRCSFEDLDRWHVVSRAGEDNLLMTFDPTGVGLTTAFWSRLDAAMTKLAPVTGAIVDTAADTFGGNENIRPQVRQYIQSALTRLAIKHQCAVILAAHPSLSGLQSGEGTGGSTAWNNSVRSRLYLYRDQDDVTRLERKKSNYAKSGQALELHWSEGVFWEKGSSIDAKAKEDRARELFVELLADHCDQGVNVSLNRKGTYAPREFSKTSQAKRERVSTAAFTAAMESLIEDGIIASVEFRRDRFRLEKAVTHTSKTPKTQDNASA